MPQPPSDKPVSPFRIAMPSPRQAAEGAAVYRRRRQERPRQRWLRILAFLGALFVHLAFLVGVILGPAYEPVEPPSDNTPLQVRLLPKQAEEPPPPPPVRGTPPKEIGPPHKGSATAKTNDKRSSSAAAGANAQPHATPVPALETPTIAQDKPSAPKPEKTAAPLPPATLPKTAPTQELQPVKVDTPPPQVTLEQPPTAPPVPPKFQPEPVRKPQVEGTQAMPPPPSVAMPDVPAQSAPQVTPPAIAVEHAVPKPVPQSIGQAARAEVPAAPPVPEMQAIPMPAQPAPTVNLQSPDVVAKPVTVERTRPQIASPSIRVAEAELETVPLPEQARPTMERPQVPPVQAPSIKAAMEKPAVARPQISAASATTESTAKESAAQQQATESAKAQEPSRTEASAAERGQDVSTAPNATPAGSDTGTPGQSPEGSATTAQPGSGKAGLNLNLPGNGNKTGPGGAGAGQGDNSGQSGEVGQYIQLKPHGDTNIMSHGTANIGYKPTRFDKDWTPEGESSIDTALRHAVEKTTVRHTFHLAPGVRVECVIMPLLPMSLFGCGSGDPPPKPVDDKVYEKMKLAPANPLVPPAPGATAPKPAAPIRLDNSVECANARVAGGLVPPSCLNDKLTPAVPAKPASSGSSWVPASDRFH